jgi:hypothetical protein
VTSFSSGGGKQRRWRWWFWCSGAGGRACGSEREGTRETPGFYMDSEREGRGSGRGVAAGGQSGARNKRRGETASNGGD